jgi:very-short-patch-repair endonuclease
MQVPFIGSEAVANGVVRKHLLRTAFTAVCPDVYVPRGYEMSLRERATAAWLWSHRTAVIAGLTASALHGARYVEDSHPIELISPNRRPPPRIRTHKVTLGADESTVRWGLPVTTPERTAYELARFGELGAAVARLDALGNATGFSAAAVSDLAQRHKGARGMRQLNEALDLYDCGAQSPWETWLRLLLIDEGFPRPRTQIPVVSADGRRRYYLDMGWEELKLAVEYDGDQHRVDPVQFAHDIARAEDLDELEWTRVRVVKRNTVDDIVRRVSRAYEASVHSARERRRIRDLSAPSAHH